MQASGEHTQASSIYKIYQSQYHNAIYQSQYSKFTQALLISQAAPQVQQHFRKLTSACIHQQSHISSTQYQVATKSSLNTQQSVQVKRSSHSSFAKFRFQGSFILIQVLSHSSNTALTGLFNKQHIYSSYNRLEPCLVLKSIHDSIPSTLSMI